MNIEAKISETRSLVLDGLRKKGLIVKEPVYQDCFHKDAVKVLVNDIDIHLDVRENKRKVGFNRCPTGKLVLKYGDYGKIKTHIEKKNPLNIDKIVSNIADHVARALAIKIRAEQDANAEDKNRTIVNRLKEDYGKLAGRMSIKPTTDTDCPVRIRPYTNFYGTEEEARILLDAYKKIDELQKKR